MNDWGDPTHDPKRQLDRYTHFRTTMQQSHTAWNTICGVRMSPLSNRTCGHPTARTKTRWIMPFGWSCRSACTMVESLRTWNNWIRRILLVLVPCHYFAIHSSVIAAYCICICILICAFIYFIFFSPALVLPFYSIKLCMYVLEWCALSQRFTDGSINQWRRRLHLQENGGHIEQKFN